MEVLLLLLFIFFVFIVICCTTNTSKPADHKNRNYKDSHDGSFDTATIFSSAQNISNHNSFDSSSDNCSSDSNCDCGGSDGGGCD